MIDKESSEVISNEGDTDVDQVPQPSRHHIVLCRGGDDVDERRGEKLVSVKQEIVKEPTGSRTDKSTSEMGHDEFERSHVVTGLVDPCVLFRSLEGGRGVDFLVVSVVGQPEGHECHDTE